MKTEINIDRAITELKEVGITLIPNILTPEECSTYRSHSELLLAKFLEEKRPLRANCQFITSPFRHDAFFLNLIYQDFIEKILGQLLDEEFVLINSNLINRRERADIRDLIARNQLPERDQLLGESWHTDSRYLGGRRLDWGFGYIVATLFNEFSHANASMKYVPKSHLFRNRPEREAPYEYDELSANAGSVVIFDCGLWHRGGVACENDRWGLFSFYGPWFMKPYYRYPEMLGAALGETLSKPLKRLLHYGSWPPLNDEERDNTVLKDY